MFSRRCSLVLAAAGIVGCSDPHAPSTPLDAGLTATPPDLAPTCLPVEPAPPEVDPNCPVVRPAESDALDETLARVQLDRCSLSLSTSGFSRDPYRLPWFDRVHGHPVNAPAFSRTLTARLDEAARSKMPVAGQLVYLGNRLGATIDTCVPAAVTDGARPLASAIGRLIEASGGTADAAALDAAVEGVPLDLQQALAATVAALAAADADWRALVRDFSSDELFSLGGASALLIPSGLWVPPNVTDSATRTLLAKTFDPGALVAAAARLAGAVEQADLVRFAGRRGFAVDVATPIGRIVVGDAEDHTYDDTGDAVALLVDTGGDDTYVKAVGAVGGTQTVGDEPIHVAFVVDLAGRDTWRYPEVPHTGDTLQDKAMPGIKRLPSDEGGRYTRRGVSDYGPISLSDEVRQGGARLGIGLVFDLGTEADHYRSLRTSQGFGVAGVGVLFDAGGDDLYEGENAVQGAAVFGVGLLLDLGGDDRYRTYAHSQGFAYVRGVGSLWDGGGNDQYLADSGIPALGGDPIYPSPQAPCDRPGAWCGNSSFVQGVGFGRRAPGNGDNAFMSGGLGVLRDLGGNDVYLASVFAQSSGYWFGTGILADGGGDDRYDGWWYTQGSAAHAALCVFDDTAGNDKYDVTYPDNPPYATNTGQGHDFSVGWHIDGGGDDVYRAPGLGLGGGNANGGGFFVNLGGSDRYQSLNGTVLGGAAFDLQSGRSPETPCYGLFLDIGGRDTYSVPPDPRLMPHPADDTAWSNRRDDAPYNDRSVGVDRAAGAVTFP